MKKGWLRSKLISWLAVLLTVATLPLVPVQRAQAATLGFTTLTWNSGKGSWQEGNPGSYPEGSFVKNIVQITNASSKPITLGEIDLRFSFFDGTNSVGVDYAKNFYYSSNVSVSAGTAILPSGPGWATLTPSIVNMPWTGTVGSYASTENQSSPYLDHFWGITPSSLGVADTVPANTTLTIYFETHLSYSFIWQNGKENLLPIDGTSPSANITRSGGTGWTVKRNGSGYFPGSKLHGNLECNVTGEKTLSVPAVTQVNGSISGYKVNDANWNKAFDSGESGVANWPVSANTTVDGIPVRIDKLTANDGSYAFSSLPYAKFTVAEGTISWSGYVPTQGSLTSYDKTLTPVASPFPNTNFYNHQPGTIVFSVTSANITYGESSISLGGRIDPTPPITAKPTGNVVVTLNITSATASVDNATGTFSSILATSGLGVASSPYVVTYSYSGDGNFIPATNNSTTLTVNKATPPFTALISKAITYGDAFTTLGGTIGSGSLIPTGAVSITLNGITQSASIDAATGNFSWSFATANLGVPGSPYTVTYAYPGSANFSSATDTSARVTVAKASPSFSNLSSPNISWGLTPTIIGGTIEAGSAIPSGNVTIGLNGDNRPATINPDGSFSSAFATDTLSPADSPFAITFTYTGDANFNAVGPVSSNLTVINQAPVAKLDYFPKTPVEGFRIRLTDNSTDPNSPDHIASWHWDFYNQGSGTIASSDLREPFIIPSNEGIIKVTLTVTDSLGKPGVSDPTYIIVANAAPVVHALNTEVFPGDNATVFGRFIDPSWTDNHTPSFSINGTAGGVNGSWVEDHFALMGTGVVSGNTTLPVTSNMTGTLTVTDTADNLSTGSSNFTITVVPRDPYNHEPNDTLAQATKANAGGRYLSFIQAPGDVDVYEIMSDNGSALAAGSEVLVGLKDLPADYDLILVQATPKAGNIAGGTISGGTISGGTISGGTISGGTISGGTISAAQGTGGTISGGTISGTQTVGGTISGTVTAGGTISGGTISGGTISGGTISGGTISGGTISNVSFAGGTISPGTISGLAIVGGTISGGTISGTLASGGTISGGTISGGTISGGTISGGTISGGTISGGTISGGTISGGTISGGTISGTLSANMTVTDATVSGGTISPTQIGGGTISGGTISGGTISGGTISAARIGGGTISGGTISGGTISSLGQYPLSQMGFTGLGAGAQTNLGGNDLSFSELGLSLSTDSLGPLTGYDISVVRFSANHGTQDEACLTSVDSGTRLFAVVVGANEAFSADKPYTLQVETSSPLDIAALLRENNITYPAPVGDWGTSTQPATLYKYGGAPSTLFVTQQERMTARYGADNWSAVSTNLTALAGRSDVAGDIVSLPISIYQRWDQDYSSIDATSNITGEIRNFVLGYLSGQRNANKTIKNVVFVGNDEIIPFGRIPDETTLGNERQYLLSSFLKPGSPEFFSILDGFILSDDFYVDSSPTPWNGGSLCLPDVAVARLVEKPGDIIADIQAFVDSNGVLAPQTGLVSGYDFFVDAATAVSSHLNAAGVDTDNTSLVSSNWTAQALKAKLLATGHDINDINAHYTSYAALSAAGFASGNFTDVMTSTEANDSARNTDNLTRSIIFTMGCHAGLNVPDEAAYSSSDLGTSLNPQLDFPQAFRRAIFVGNTGYGYGDDAGLGGSEHLMEIFTKKLLQSGTVSAGDALRAAKQRYILGLSTVSVYEAKAALEFTFYGLPQYKINAPKPLPADTLDSADGNLTLTVGDNVTTYGFNKVVTDAGMYWTADGDAQATPYRPIMPRVVFPIAPAANPVHGALWTGGAFRTTDNVDPAITIPTNEWEQKASESQSLSPTYWPSDLVKVNSTGSSGNLTQTLVIIPAQFKPSSQSGNVTGTMRIFGGLNFELLRSASPDWQAPTIERVNLHPAGANVTMTIGASDPSGISRIVILRLTSDGSITPYDHASLGLPLSGNFTYNVPFATEDRFVIQVVDGAGNVATYTGKGPGLTLIPVVATSDPSFVAKSPVSFTATISGFDGLAKPVFYWWNFGDGKHATGQATSATFTLQHTYDGSVAQPRAVVKVTDTDGGVGIDSLLVTEKTTPGVTVVSSNATPLIGQPATFTATVAAAAQAGMTWVPSPSGTVVFSDNRTVLGSANLTSSGPGTSVAVFTSSLNATGPSVITANYTGDQYYFNATGSTSENLTYSCQFQSPIAGSTYNIGRQLPVKFRFTDYNGNAVPTATPHVYFSRDAGATGTDMGAATLSGGYYHLNVDTNGLAAGRLWIYAVLSDGTLWNTYGESITLK